MARSAKSSQAILVGSSAGQPTSQRNATTPSAAAADPPNASRCCSGKSATAGSARRYLGVFRAFRRAENQCAASAGSGRRVARDVRAANGACRRGRRSYSRRARRRTPPAPRAARALRSQLPASGQWTSFAAVEALGHGEAFLGQLDGVEQRDLRGRTAEPDAALAAAHGLDQPGLDQRLDQLEQEQFGDRMWPWRCRQCGSVGRVDRAIDQGADGVIGLAGKPHRDDP